VGLRPGDGLGAGHREGDAVVGAADGRDLGTAFRLLAEVVGGDAQHAQALGTERLVEALHLLELPGEAAEQRGVGDEQDRSAPCRELDLRLSLLEGAFHAEAGDVDLLVLPGGVLSGYPPQDLVLRPAFVARAEAALEALAARVRGSRTAALVGLPIRGLGRPHNAAVLLRPDGTREIMAKQELPKKDLFDEVRRFAPGLPSLPVLIEGLRLGVLIREDLRRPGPAARLASASAEAPLAINGSLFEAGKADRRVSSPSRACVRPASRRPISTFVGRRTRSSSTAPPFCSALPRRHPDARRPSPKPSCVSISYAVLRGSPSSPSPRRLPHGRTGNASRWLACVASLRGRVRKNGLREVLLGLSGGIDSAAAVAAMAADALGPEEIRAVSLPSALTLADGTSVPLTEARAVRLGIRLSENPILSPVSALSEALGPAISAPEGVAAGPAEPAGP